MITNATSETAAKDATDLVEIQAIVLRPDASDVRIKAVMESLQRRRSDYHWVGVYRLVGEELHLGPYVGPFTDHTRIPVGRGVCGTAVAENTNQIVGDVRELTNYLACNVETRSEIVVLIRAPSTSGPGRIIGQIDVDGTKVNQFGEAEEAFLQAVAALLAPVL